MPRLTHNSNLKNCGLLPEIQSKIMELQVKIKTKVCSAVIEVYRDLREIQVLVTKQLEANGAY